MKKLLYVLIAFICFLCFVVSAYAEQNTEKELTLMVYMCGSNLQSQNNCADVDMEEMKASGLDPAQVNLVVLTGGALKPENWTTPSLHHLESEKNVFVKKVSNNTFKQQDAEYLGTNMGEADTLSNYIRYCIEQYPAKKYALILWDHGEGPLGHLCHDECNSNDGLTISELAEALEEARLPGKLGWIGFDACLMSTAEVALTVSPYAEYMIASQETEPETGWNYRFLKEIEKDKNGAETGERIINAYLEGNKGVVGLTLSCVDLSKIQHVADEMDTFFEPLSKSLDEASFARLSELRSSSTHFGEVVRSVDNGYDLVDLQSLVTQFQSFGDSTELENALKSTVFKNGSNIDGAGGLSVYHPYHNKDAYLISRCDQYQNLLFSEGYQRYVERFGAMLTGSAFADWSEIRLQDDGASVANKHTFSLQMTDEQQQNYASSQLIILGALGTASDVGIYEGQISFEDEKGKVLECYYPVWIGDAAEAPNGLLSATYTSRSLYVTDENGIPIAGPISYRLSDDGEQIYIFTQYQDNSGREGAAPMIRVLYTCTVDEKTGAVSIANTAVYDNVTMTYTRRLGFVEADYTEMFIDRLARCVPESDGALPAFADWIKVVDSIELSLPLKWELHFFDAQLSGTQLFATMQVTDTQQNSYCTPLIPVKNPNLYDIDVSPRTISGDGFDLTLYAVLDSSPLEAGLNIGIEISDDARNPDVYILVSSVLINNTRDSGIGSFILRSKDRRAIFHIDESSLIGFDSIDSITLVSSNTIGSNITQLFQLSSGNTQKSVSIPEKLLREVPDYGVTWEVSDYGVTWQIVDLTFNKSGDLEGILHVANSTDKEIRRNYIVAVNDCVQADTELYMNVAAYSDLYRRFTISNRFILPNFTVDGSNSRFQLGAERIFQRSGIHQIESLKFLEPAEKPSHTLIFKLTNPLPLPDFVQNEFLPVRGKLLLDGDVQASISRVLLGHRAVGVLLTMQNTLDRDIYIEVPSKMVDGIEYGNFVSGKADSIILGANCTGMLGLKIDVGGNMEVISEIGLAFRYDNLTSRRAHICLDQPSALNMEGGICLGEDHFTTVPVSHRKSQIIVNEDVLKAGDSQVSLTMDLQNYWIDDEPAEEQLFSELLATFWITKHSDENLTYTLENFVINDRRCISESYKQGKADGNTISKYLEIDEFSPWREQLVNIKEISSISCDLRVKHPGGEEELFPLRWTIQNCSLEGIVDYVEPCGQTSEDGIIWELLSVDARSKWQSSISQMREIVTCVFCVKNESEKAYTGQLDALLINHVMNSELEKQILLPVDKEKIIELEFENYGDFDSLLQNCSYDAVENIALYLKSDESQGAQEHVITLENPVMLPAADEKVREKFRDQYILVDDNVTVGLSYLTVRDDGLSLTLSMQNKSDKSLRIELTDLYAGSIAMKQFKSYYCYVVLPHSTRMETFVVVLPYDESVSVLPGNIRFSLSVGDQVYDDIEIRTEAPLLLGSGFQCFSNQIRVISASTLLNGHNSDLKLDLEGFSFELGVLPYKYSFTNEVIIDYSQFRSGVFYIEDLKEKEFWYPAMKLYNYTGEDAEFSIWCEINGINYQWGKVLVSSGEFFIAYAQIEERNQSVGEYNCVFYLNSSEVCSGVVDVRNKKTIFDLDTASVGDVFFLGTYEQDNNLTNGKEPIEWLVLDRRDDQAIAISRYALDCQPYHSEYTEITWDHCSLRGWLNDVFYPEAFTLGEQRRIASETVKADPNPAYNLDPGNDTEDQVFLLSVLEAEQLFSSDLERACLGTAYCEARGAEFEDGACVWWLRTSGDCLETAAVVEQEGVICDYGVDIDYNVWIAVRPAIRINLNDGFLSMGHYEQDGNEGNGPEDIEWVILDEDNGKLFLVSRYALAREPMYTHWVDSELRTWLNSVFIDIAFDEEEKGLIQTTELDNSSKMERISAPGSESYINSFFYNYNEETDGDISFDQVFLLSYSDICKYFPTKNSRLCDVTDDLKTKDPHYSWEPYYAWYLRTPALDRDKRDYVRCISSDGIFSVASFGDIYRGYRNIYYVRPALWIRGS